MEHVYKRDFDLELEQEFQEAERLKRACYTPEDLAEAMAMARKDGFEKGRAEGRREAAAEALETNLHRQTEQFELVKAKIGELFDNADDHVATLEQQVLSFVLAVFDKLAPELVRYRAGARAEDEVRAALAVALGSSSVRVFLPPDVCDTIGERLEDAAEEIGHDRRIEIIADENMEEGDACVEWDNGFMEYSFKVICDRILTALRAAALLPGSTPNTPSEE